MICAAAKLEGHKGIFLKVQRKVRFYCNVCMTLLFYFQRFYMMNFKFIAICKMFSKSVGEMKEDKS